MVRRKKKPPLWEQVGTIESESEPGVVHKIKRHVNTGLFGCDCLSYRFARGEKTCKHLDAWRGDIAAEPYREMAHGDLPRSHRPKSPPTIVVGTERFTVRRAIAFGGVPMMED